MPLIEAPPPEAMKQVYLEGLGVDQSWQLSFSVPVYSLSVVDLRKKADPLRLQLLGWQFLTIDPKGTVVGGEVPNEPDHADGTRTTSLTRGPIVDEAWQAYRAIKAHPEVLDKPIELRHLRISSLRIEAFWLKTPPSDDVLGPSDLVYPFFTFHTEIKSKLLPAHDFLSFVRKLVAKAPPRNLPGIGQQPVPRPLK
jgi:hypothetical protein